MRVATYVRVSTDRQDAEVQRPALERLCEARGWTVSEVFVEVESGAKSRPILDDVCARAAKGEFTVIVTWALDRLGRSMWDVIDRVRRLDAANVRIVSYSEPWLDTGSPARALLLSIFAWVAEQERTRLIERTKAGMARARQRGARIGRPPTVAPADVVSRRATGTSWRQIAKALACSIASARRAVTRAKGHADMGAAVAPINPSKSEVPHDP